MSDRKHNPTGDSALDREVEAVSRSYRQADAELPPAAMDDAIRAAARRAVKSQPRAVGGSWMSRWSTPLSAAAAVVLTVSIGYRMLLEQPDLAPTVSRETASGKVAQFSPPKTPADAAASVTSAAAPPSSPPALVSAEKTVLAESGSLDRARAAPLPNSDRKQRAPEPRAAPGPVTLSTPAFAPDPATNAPLPKQSKVVLAQSAAPELTEQKDLSRQLAVATTPSRSEDAVAAAKADRQVPAPATAPAPAAAPPPAPVASLATAPMVAAPAKRAMAADVSSEPPAAWLKRVLELKREGKVRAFEEELAKFRKRHPDYLLPEELSAYK